MSQAVGGFDVDQEAGLIRKFLMAVVISSVAPGALGEEFNHFGVSANLLAKMTNIENADVVGQDAIDSGAYRFAFSYALAPNDSPPGTWGKPLNYLSFQAFQSKESGSGSGASSGGVVTSIKGIAVVAGQRFFPSKKPYQGIGLGWYAGVASLKEQWLQKPVASLTPAETSSTIPVAAVEVFYKIDISRHVFLEPSSSFVWRKTKAGNFSGPIMLNLGAQF